MARTIPGSGAVIEPIFNDVFGVRAVKVIEGGSEYTSSDPPRLTINGCGTPVEEALLYPIIDDVSGRITHVRVLNSGRGYDPLRLAIIPEQDTPDVVSSFDISRIWQSDPNSQTTGTFATDTDRYTVVSDNHPKPADFGTEREPGGGPLDDQTFNQTFVYRGGKDVPRFDERPIERNKALGIMSNGVLLHTPDWAIADDTPVGFNVDSVRYDYLKNADAFDGIVDGNQYYYTSNKLINHFAETNGVFENGNKEEFVWNVKTELDNIMLSVFNVVEQLGEVEVGRVVEKVGGSLVDGTFARGEIAKIVNDSNGNPSRIYLRLVQGTFENGDNLLGSTGFTMQVNADPVTFPNGIFYIDFGDEAHEFGDFVPGQYYLAPENIQVQRNYLIIWNQSDASNLPNDIHLGGHPMQFSTTPDGPLNQSPGTLYYNSTGASAAPSADYENEFRSTFIMNEDETNRIYYYCKFHRYMSGAAGDEGYMVLSPEIEDEERPNNYYISDFYTDGLTNDYSRHVTGHSRILGLSFDGYPIYGPYGYDASGNAVRMSSSYRFKVGSEIDGARPIVTTAGTVNYTVTTNNNQYLIDGAAPAFLNLDRGKTYVFNLDDASNLNLPFLLSTAEDGWHSTGQSVDIGNTNYVYSDGVEYILDGSPVTYDNYLALFNGSTTREVRFTPRANSPRLLYVFGYPIVGVGFRCVQDGYLMGDLIQDYIYEEGLGDLDKHNGKFAVTPDYPNGTYAYFMTTDSSDNPVYPYVIGPEFYSTPQYPGSEVPALASSFPSGAKGEIVLNNNGTVGYVKMTRNGDGYFGPAQARILGGEGSGATASPVVQTVTSLSLLQEGRSFATPPTLIFEGGGGQGARGRAQINTAGKVTSISINDPGEFYQEAPYILITGGGGIGAKAVATVDQGVITGITVTDPGNDYTNPPNVIFTKLVNLKRKIRARQANNSVENYITGLLTDLDSSSTDIFVDSTDAFPGSGSLIIGNEIVSYTSKSREKFQNVTRGKNFKYDQRVILDTTQNDSDGNSTYDYNVGDRVIRRIENQNNKIAKVYDWNPSTRELLVTFEVDELAFIDGGIPSTEDAIVQFDAGVAASAPSGFNPHVLEEELGSSIVLLTEPIGLLTDRRFNDDNVEDPANPGTFIGDGIPDLDNTGTDYVNQIALDGGIFSSLYGIEETIGGQNTTLFQVGDQVKDASIPFKYATILEAGGLSEGVPHTATMNIYIDRNDNNGQNYFPEELVTGEVSGVRATVTSWNNQDGILTVRNVVPFNTGNLNVGINGILYKFSDTGTIIDFIVQNPGNDYSLTPTIAIENAGDIQATATAVMTTAGDQISSVTVNNGGYGYSQYVDGFYNTRPTITINNDPSDTTGTGAVLQAILGGEMLIGNNGARYRIKRVEFDLQLRSE